MAIIPTGAGEYTIVRGSDPTKPPYGSIVPSYPAQPSWMLSYAYAAIYATQPAVRRCVDFLGRNLAQVGYHVFRRVSDTDRERLTDHPLALWLKDPNPSTDQYRLFEALMCDLALYGQAFWWKRRQAGRVILIRIPPHEVQVLGGILPTLFRWFVVGGPVDIPPGDIVAFGTYNPIDPKCGLSLLETLRRTLEEDAAATDARRRYWQNGTRVDGVIERPREAPKWNKEQKQQFREQLQARHGGPQGTGSLLVLEEGMTLKPVVFSAKESEYVPARKFANEEVASLYQIPLPMVGILDHATFCLPADTDIFTEDGPRAIADVRVGDRVWSLNAASVWTLSPVVRSACTGYDEILTLRTGNRTVRLNARHRVLARRAILAFAPVAIMKDGHRRAIGRARKVWTTDYVPAGELRVGDTIVCLKHLPVLDAVQPRLPSGRRATIGFLELCGLVLGDGNVTRVEGEPVGLQIARAEHASYMDAYRATLETLRLEDMLPGTRGPLHLIEGGRQTRLMSVAVGREFDRLGFSGTARTKRVPGWVFGLPEDYRLALLRGFLDADGSCDKRGRLSFSSASRVLLSQIRHLCLSVGIPVTNLREQSGQTRLPNGRIAAFSQWMFTCSDPGANRRIGSHTPEYQRRLAAGQPFGRKGSRYPWHGGRGFESNETQLSAITHIDRQRVQQPVYDLEVAETHSFIADGVVVHNSNIKEQHKQMLTDCLGPWFTLIEQGIEKFLLPEAADSADIYGEFNVAEKLKGSFEEQTNGLRVAVGRPFMTANEARARLNLPRITDDPTADQLAAQQGGPAGAPPSSDGGDGIGDGTGDGTTNGGPPEDPATATQMVTIVRATFARHASRLARFPPELRLAQFDQARALAELTTDLAPVVGSWDTAARYAVRIIDETVHRLGTGAAALAEGEVLSCLGQL